MAQYHVARDSTQLGTFSENEVLSGLSSGRFLPSDLVWAEGMADWQPASACFQAASAPASALSPAIGSAGPNPYAAPAAQPAFQTRYGYQPVELASLGKRFGAFVLDTVAWAAVFTVGSVFLSFDASSRNPNGELGSMGMLGVGILLICGAGLAIWNLVMLSTRGQTVGKRLLGIRIVTHPDAQNAGFVKAVLLRGFVNGLISGIPFIGLIYFIADLCFIFQADRRCLHDQIAGTQVVEGNPPTA